MCWQEFHAKARSLGFEVAMDIGGAGDVGGSGNTIQPIQPRDAAHWFQIGGYGGEGRLWVCSLNQSAESLPHETVADLLAHCDPYVEPLADYDPDYLSAAAPFWAQAKSSLYGCMLA